MTTPPSPSPAPTLAAMRAKWEGQAAHLDEMAKTYGADITPKYETWAAEMRAQFATDAAEARLLASALADSERLNDALRLIANERERQQTKEGWTEAHDDEHTDGSLATVAALYALPSEVRDQKLLDKSLVESLWPYWDWHWWKPKPRNRVRELVKAGALIVAEIERLQRASGGES